LKPKGCVHHYMLPEPNGANEVVGVCKKCGDEKVHQLVIPWLTWNPWRGDPKKAEEAKEAKKKQEIMSAGAAEKHRRSYAQVYRSKNKEGENGKRPK
jgi:hypothetical protein